MQLAGAAIFCKLDANGGFCLAEESSKLTTFITPFERSKLLFGVSLAHLSSSKADKPHSAGIKRHVCLMDDVLVFGANQEEHNSRLTAVLERVQAAGVTLNPDKCEFHRKSTKFLGHLIDEEGIKTDPEKTSAITKMPTPQCVTDLRRFMGLANQLGKFSPNLAELSQPLRELLSTKRAWVWGPNQEQAFT